MKNTSHPFHTCEVACGAVVLMVRNVCMLPIVNIYILLLVLASTIGSHICNFLGYVVSLQARSCNEMAFPSFFNNIQFSLEDSNFGPRN